MPSRPEILASYVPTLLTRRLPFDAEPRPTGASMASAVLFADISGFTAMTERLAQLGPAGTERLTAILNGYFSDLIELVASWGGDVVKFAGDAMLAVWPEEQGQDLAAATLAATQCGSAMQRLNRPQQSPEEVSLSLRVAVGAGQLALSSIGGLNGHWEFMLTGAPLVDLSLAEQQAQPGELLLTREAGRLVADQIESTPLPDGTLRVTRVSGRRGTGLLPTPLPSRSDEPFLWRYLPTAIHARLQAGQMGWLAELRQVTTLFVNLKGFHQGVSLERAQVIMLALEEVIDRYEGSVNKLSVDDKGVTMVAAFGLPPLSHEDDALRAVKAALDIQASLNALDVAHAIGMSTGRAFCGEVGNDRRREYTMIGDPINLAARLMQAASDEGILCDRPTAQLVQDRVTFRTLEPLHLKGKSQPVAIYRPTAVGQKAELPPTSMVGRTEERERLARAVQSLLEGQSARILVEAEAGMGKSRLVADMLQTAGVYPLKVLQGAADAVEKSRPYHAWRGVFAAMVELESAPNDPAERQRYLLGKLRALLIDADEHEWLDLLPLLNSHLPLDLPESPLIAQMHGHARADSTDKLLVKLLQGFASQYRVLLVIDDGHWLDSASLRLLKLVGTVVHPLVLVLSTRPMAEPWPTDFRTFKDHVDLHLRLNSLTFEETMSLVCKRLGVSRLPDTVAELIRTKAEGHPFFSEELAFSLRDAGYLDIVGGECRLSEAGQDLRALDLPTTIEGAITNRVDRLTPCAQLAIKVASVIGRVFAYRTLRDIYPIEAERSQLAGYLETLERLDLTPLDAPEPELAYIFKHIITQEVVYNLMLFSQRQQLHRLVAEWIEQTYAQDLEQHYPLLAHHWSKAEVLDKAVAYLEHAGDFALQSGAFPETMRFYDEALAFVQSGKVSVARERLGHWHLQLAKAHIGFGNIQESERHCFEALALVDRPFPTHQGMLMLGLLGNILRQALHRFFPDRFIGPPTTPDERERRLFPARVSEILYELFINDDQPLGLVYASLSTLNLAESLAPNGPLVWAYAMMAVIAAPAQLEGLADYYERLAFDAARHVTDVPVLAGMYIRLSARHLTSGHWSRAIEISHETMNLCSRISDTRKWAESLAVCANAMAYQGRLTESLLMFKNIYTEMRRIDANQFLVWGASGEVSALIRLGRFEEALEILEANAEEFEKTGDRILKMAFHGERAALLMRVGRDLEAWSEAVVTERMLSSHSTTYAFESLFGLCEVAVTFCLRPDAPVARKDAVRLAKRALKLARATTGMFKTGQAQRQRWEGFFALSQGKRSRAIALWRKSLASARAFELPFEQAQAHLELGSHLEQGPERDSHLEAARSGFEALGCVHELERTVRSMAAAMDRDRVTR